MGSKEAQLLATKHTWEGGMRFPLRRSSSTVPKLKMTLSGVTLPEKKRNCHKKDVSLVPKLNLTLPVWLLQRKKKRKHHQKSNKCKISYLSFPVIPYYTSYPRLFSELSF